MLVTSKEERRCRGRSDAAGSASALREPRHHCTPGWVEGMKLIWAGGFHRTLVLQRELGRNSLLSDGFQFNEVNKGCINPGEWVGVWGQVYVIGWCQGAGKGSFA